MVPETCLKDHLVVVVIYDVAVPLRVIILHYMCTVTVMWLYHYSCGQTTVNRSEVSL